jgi:hypothetical protein
MVFGSSLTVVVMFLPVMTACVAILVVPVAKGFLMVARKVIVADAPAGEHPRYLLLGVLAADIVDIAATIAHDAGRDKR